ncbi:MAG TPA: MBL fold metallo-hydrolase [Nocardioidaceae bacterium]|nr:MBL fold metallo-hydrolase [Nocardioidaceae bacterium]
METHRATPDVTVLNDHLPVPTIGFLPINAFVVHAEQPVVVDTGVMLPDRNFLDDLGSVIDPADVRWIWLTHPDRDHTGGLVDLLEAAPEARVVTTFLSVGIMSTHQPLPLDRVYLINPGQSLNVGDRTLTAFRPALFDSPATIGFFDHKSRALVSSDCFGAPMLTEELATSDDAHDVPPEDLRAAQLLWATVDSPWIHTADQEKYMRTVEPMREMEPEAIFSSHLPPLVGRTSASLDMLSAAPSATPWTGPDQRALEEMLAGFEPAAPAG